MDNFIKYERQNNMDFEVSHINDFDFTRFYSKIPYISIYDTTKSNKEESNKFYRMILESDERISSDGFINNVNIYDRMIEYMNYIYLFTYLHRMLTDGLRGKLITDLLDSEPLWMETKSRIDNRLTRNQRFGLEYEISLIEDVADVLGFVRMDLIKEDLYQLLLVTENDIFFAYTTQSNNPQEIINFLNIHCLIKTIISMAKYISSGKNNSLFTIYFKYFMNSFNAYRFFDFARERSKRYVKEKYKVPEEILVKDPLTVLPEGMTIKDFEKDFIASASSENIYMMDISGFTVTKEGQKYLFMDEVKRICNVLYGVLEPYHYENRDPYNDVNDSPDDKPKKNNLVYMIPPQRFEK